MISVEVSINISLELLLLTSKLVVTQYQLLEFDQIPQRGWNNACVKK